VGVNGAKIAIVLSPDRADLGPGLGHSLTETRHLGLERGFFFLQRVEATGRLDDGHRPGDQRFLMLQHHMLSVSLVGPRHERGGHDPA
jgi:hypothetical protein